MIGTQDRDRGWVDVEPMSSATRPNRPSSSPGGIRADTYQTEDRLPAEYSAPLLEDGRSRFVAANLRATASGLFPIIWLWPPIISFGLSWSAIHRAFPQRANGNVELRAQTAVHRGWEQEQTQRVRDPPPIAADVPATLLGEVEEYVWADQREQDIRGFLRRQAGF